MPSNRKDKEWTLLAYMAGDNNLTAEMAWALQSMKKTLDTNARVKQRVGVIAQYDASGLKPCLLYPANGKTDKGQDGNLDETRAKEYDSAELYRRLKDSLTPNREHWAIAIWEHHRQDTPFKALVDSLARRNLTGGQCERFVLDLIACDDEVRGLVFESDAQLALALAQTLKKGALPSNQEMDRAREAATRDLRVSIRKAYGAMKIDALKRNPNVASLARRLAESTDSVARIAWDITSAVTVKQFIQDQMRLVDKNHLKANHYLVVLSGHGAGVSGDFLTDDDPHSSLTIPRLGKDLEEAMRALQGAPKKKLDILGIDSCLMGMVEVAYEVQDYVEFLVGSEGFVNNTGWPYHRVLETLAEAQTAEAAAKGIVEKYAAFYQDYEMAGCSTHVAAIELSKLGHADESRESGTPAENCNLATAVKLLGKCLKEALDSIKDEEEKKELKPGEQRSPGQMVRDAVVLAHWYAQSFKWGEHADLWDFCGQLGRIIPPDQSEIRSWCGKVQRAIEDAVDKRTWYGGPEFQHAHGISIYFPWSARDVARGYRRLKFAQETGWADFLGVYLQTTRRLRRAPDEKAKPRRMGSDFEEFLESVDLSWREAATYQDSKVASYFGSKVASYYGSKVASPFGSKVASPFESRVASPYESKMLGGKIISPANFQNVPDGYFRQKIGAANVFIDNEGVPHPEKSIGRKS